MVLLIAVGVATNIPPATWGETIDGKLMMDNPDNDPELAGFQVQIFHRCSRYGEIRYPQSL